MKNRLLIATAILIALNGISCKQQGSTTSIIGQGDGPTAIYIDEQPDFLLRKGLDLIHEMHDLANDSNYIKLPTTWPKTASLHCAMMTEVWDNRPATVRNAPQKIMPRMQPADCNG